MKVINIITEIFAKLKDGSGNLITSTDLGNDKRGLDVRAEIKDRNGDSVEICPVGRLHTTDAIPYIFIGHTFIVKSISQAILGHNYETVEYLIPTGKKLYILKMGVTGIEGDSSGGLYYCPSGVLDGTEVDLMGIFFNSGLWERQMDLLFTGDGTAKIIFKMTRRDKGKRWVSGGWEGFVEN
jgi:hypothetical protein